MTGLAATGAFLACVVAQEGFDLLERESIQPHDARAGPERGRHDPERFRLALHLDDHPRAVHTILATPLGIAQEVGPGGQEHLDRPRAAHRIRFVRYLDQELLHVSPPCETGMRLTTGAASRGTPCGLAVCPPRSGPRARRSAGERCRGR